MRFISLHEFIKHVYARNGHNMYLCVTAKRHYGVGGRYAMVKLLEESYPGVIYGRHWPEQNFASAECLSFEIIRERYTDETGDVAKPFTRPELVQKLLRQPDRLIVLPDAPDVPGW